MELPPTPTPIRRISDEWLMRFYSASWVGRRKVAFIFGIIFVRGRVGRDAATTE
jgi:hypothetical protein